MPLHLRWAAPLRAGVALLSGGRHGTVAGAVRHRSGAHRRTPVACRSKEGTHAHRGQARDGRRAARGTRQQPDDDRVRVPRPQGEGDRRDPARPAQAGRHVSRRQEPPDAHRRRGLGRRGARPAPHRPDRDRVRERRGRDRQGRPRRDPAVQQDRPDHRRRPGRPGDRRRRRHPSRRPAVARGPAGQAGRWDAGAGRRPWPACSPRPCATWAMPWRRSPSRRPRPASA